MPFTDRGKFLESAGGLGGARRYIIDICLEAGAGNTRSVQRYIDQREVRTLLHFIDYFYFFPMCDNSSSR